MSDTTQIPTSLLVKLLRGLDNGMPESMRGAWEQMTPEFQAQKQRELMMQQMQQQNMEQAGADPVPAEEGAEYEQYRAVRR